MNMSVECTGTFDNATLLGAINRALLLLPVLAKQTFGLEYYYLLASLSFRPNMTPYSALRHNANTGSEPRFLNIKPTRRQTWRMMESSVRYLIPICPGIGGGI